MLKKIIISKFRYPDENLDNLIQRGYPFALEIFFGIVDILCFLYGDLITKIISFLSLLLEFYAYKTYKDINKDFFSKVRFIAVDSLAWSFGFMMSGILVFHIIQKNIPIKGINILFFILIEVLITISLKLIGTYVHFHISENTHAKMLKSIQIISYIFLVILYPTLTILYVYARLNNSNLVYSVVIIIFSSASALFFSGFLDKSLIYLNRDMLRDYINNQTTDNKTNQE